MQFNKIVLATSVLALTYFSPASFAQEKSRIQLSGAVMQSWQRPFLPQQVLHGI